jgi:copper chaperone CopZ
MTCDHCVNAVTAELSAIAGVNSIEVDLDSGHVSIESADELSAHDIAAAIDEAGYSLT